jgi:hypothetical protein
MHGSDLEKTFWSVFFDHIVGIQMQLTLIFNRFSHTSDHLPSRCPHSPLSHELTEVKKGS